MFFQYHNPLEFKVWNCLVGKKRFCSQLQLDITVVKKLSLKKFEGGAWKLTNTVIFSFFFEKKTSIYRGVALDLRYEHKHRWTAYVWHI